MNRTLDVLTSTLASTVRGWRGTTGSKTVELPAELPVLFDCEGDAECRLVREALSELNMDAMIYPCPRGGLRHQAKLQELSGGDKVPFLFDPNTGRKEQGAKAIVDYLFQQYRGKPAPAALAATPRNLFTSSLASRIRFNLGIKAKSSQAAAQPLTLYSFESSPYSRLVREKLCELELPYKLVNLSKQQRADMGPAKFRMHTGPYKPIPNSKREAFLKQYGDVMVPFLIDPNKGQEMFESADILRYLEQAYSA